MIWEVFRQERKGQAFQHAGSLSAPDRTFAEEYAREFYGRRAESEALWVVPRDAILEVGECNCSMCSKTGYLHLMVPAAQFKLLSGEDALTHYQFNTKTAKHFFCSHCGIKSFYVPRSHPDGYSINARCLDEGTVTSLKVEPFDGSNWEQHAAALAHLSL